MLKKILLGLVAVITLLVVVVALQPSEFSIARSAHVAAPPEVVHGRVADFHAWPSWSPWQDLDPSQTTTFSGAESGVGAKYGWEGNDKVGKGEMEITGDEAPSKVKMTVHFLAPFEAKNDVDFDIAPEGDGSSVTWTMHGTNGFLAKAAGLFMDMDAMVGADFEKGLKKLDAASAAEAKRLADEKAAAEAAAQASAAVPADGTAPVPAPAEGTPTPE